MKDDLAFEFFNIVLPASRVQETLGNVRELVHSGDIDFEVEDNLLRAELFVATISQKDIPLSAKILSELSKIVYGKLYTWAGKIRVEARAKLEELLSLVKEEWELSLLDEDVRLDLITTAYHGILNIRPFFDGNEKVARLFVNYLALKHNLHLFAVAPKDKNSDDYRKYIRELRLADKGDTSLLRARMQTILKGTDLMPDSKLGPSAFVGD